MFLFECQKQLFPNTLCESTCLRVSNTAQIIMTAFLSTFLINPRQIELENMSLDQIENFRTVS